MKKFILALILTGCGGEPFSTELFHPSDAPDAGDVADALQGAGGAAPSSGGASSGGDVGTGGHVASTGGRSTGGVAATGGAALTGGSPSTGGTASSTGGVSTGGMPETGGASGCAPGEKICDGSCVQIDASVNGCNPSSCDPCPGPAPVGGVLTCNAQGQCDFVCTGGRIKLGGQCVPSTP